MLKKPCDLQKVFSRGQFSESINKALQNLSIIKRTCQITEWSCWKKSVTCKRFFQHDLLISLLILYEFFLRIGSLSILRDMNRMQRCGKVFKSGWAINSVTSVVEFCRRESTGD